jgi:hypothetical protein
VSLSKFLWAAWFLADQLAVDLLVAGVLQPRLAVAVADAAAADLATAVATRAAAEASALLAQWLPVLA